MKLTREEALKLHGQMWGDMKAELGDNPSKEFRLKFKEDWCRRYFPNYWITSNCFLCEYIDGLNRCDADSPQIADCDMCPIVWPNETCYYNDYYYNAPISEILALPERIIDGIDRKTAGD